MNLPSQLILLDDLAKANKEIDEWMSIAAELKEKYPVLFEALTD